MAERERSWWGWGWADAAVAGDELSALAVRVRALLPLDGELMPIPAIGSLTVPEPRIQPGAAVAQLCTVDTAQRVRHTYGRAYRDIVRALRGDFAVAPDIVALPRTEDDVAALLDWAGTADVAVVPFGGGTSVVGGVECRDRSRPVCSLDLRGLVEVLAPEDLVESVGFGRDAAYSAGPPEQGLQPLSRQFRGLCRGRGRSQDRAGLP